MPINVDINKILSLAPSIRSSYREAFTNGQALLDAASITASPLRIAHFMAQVLHESGGLTILFENLNYSPQRLPVVWPTRFLPGGALDPVQYAHDPQKLANEVYGGRMGNTSPNDGYTYRGRGLLQITGKASYQRATTDIRKISPDAPDFVMSPDEAISPQWSLAVAISEWTYKNCNALADEDSIRKVTLRINGGLTGLGERIDWLRKTKIIWS